MESYYSSDEEIAWGPVTLREIKGDLKRPVRKPHRRRSMPNDFKMDPQKYSRTVCQDSSVTSSEEPSHLCQEVTNKLNISPTSTEYYTPNESLRTENNCDFLEKLSKVINEPQPDSSTLDSTKTSILTNTFNASIPNSECINSSYYSTQDHLTNMNAGMNDSYFNFLKTATERKTYYDIDNFQQTLVGNTVIEPSGSEAALQIDEKLSFIDEDSLCENENMNPETSEVLGNISGENVVVISDDESDNSGNNVSTSEESNDREFSLDSMDDVKDQDLNKDMSIQEKQYDLNLKGGYEASFGGDKISEQKECSEISEEKGLIIPIIQFLPPIKEKRSFSNSPISIPDIDLAQFDDSPVKSDDPQLNDTMEEMNRLLSDGLNYTVSDDESIIESTPQKNDSKSGLQFTPSNIISGSFIQTQIPIHSSNIKQKTIKTPSESNHPFSEKKNNQYDRKTPDSHRSDTKKTTGGNRFDITNRFDIKKTPDGNRLLIKKTPDSNRFDIKKNLDSNFKIPERPARAKLTNPTPPKSYCNLKNVISPVALYINNSPNVPLRQNVPHRDLFKIAGATKIPMPSTKENFPDLPEKTYKPSKKQISLSEKEVVLPPSIKRLNVKEPNIIRHEGRIHQSINQLKVNRKLLQTDITNVSIDSSMLDNSKDVSVLTSKQAFIQ